MVFVCALVIEMRTHHVQKALWLLKLTSWATSRIGLIDLRQWCAFKSLAKIILNNHDYSLHGLCRIFVQITLYQAMSEYAVQWGTFKHQCQNAIANTHMKSAPPPQPQSPKHIHVNVHWTYQSLVFCLWHSDRIPWSKMGSKASNP